MYFKLKCIVRDFSLSKDEVLHFNIDGTHLVKIKIRRPNKQEQKRGHNVYNLSCSAHMKANVSEKNENIFKEIEQSKILNVNTTSKIEYTDQKGNGITIPGIEDFPEHYQSMLSQTRQELLESLKLVVNAMRWRTNKLGPHNILNNCNMYWSRDKKFWHPVPSSFSVSFMDSPSRIPLPKKINKDIEHFINIGLQEPVYHELFREAWTQRTSNPRSSLIIGMSSLEVAIKETISNLNPNSSWLIENLQSPSVLRLLTEYIPELPTKKKIKKKVFPLPKKITDLIKKGVTIRNKIAHLGGESPSNKSLKQILESIRDVIWSLEYYCGHKWAYDFISEETRLALEE